GMTPEAVSGRLCASGMGDDQQGWGVLQHALQRLVQGLGVEGSEALVEDETVGTVEQGAGNIEPAALALRELPAGLTHHLQQTGWHAVEEGPEAKGAAQGLGLRQVLGAGRPAAAQEQVEGDGAAKDVVIVELGRSDYAPPPSRRA